jgi:hypothetical protein
MNIHNGLKPYKCQLCGMDFAHVTNLSRHTSKSHAANGQFSCENNCGCVFAQFSQVAHHRRHCSKGKASEASPAPLVTPRKVSSEKRSSLNEISSPHLFRLLAEPQELPSVLPETSEKSDETMKDWSDEIVRCKIAPGIFECPTCQKPITSSGNFR